MDRSLAHALRTFVGLPLLVVALVAGGGTGLAGLQLTSGPAAEPTEPPRLEQALRAALAAEGRGETEAAEAPAVDAPAWSAGFVSSVGLAERTAAALPEPALAEPEPPSARLPAWLDLADYRGRSHFWIPKIGIDKPVVLYPCPRKRPPDHYMYRWGCAHENNVYLLGHASSVMKPLHDAYVGGRLKVGMIAIYADDAGLVRAYRVTEWRVVRPEESRWALAPQPVPSMTLQTCVGKNDEFRLNVRLVVVD